MMLVALICTDKPDHLELRKSTRDEHVAYLKASKEVKQAGPFLNKHGEMCGSLIILMVEHMSDAEAWVAEDPYTKVGLFSDVRMEHWNRVIS